MILTKHQKNIINSQCAGMIGVSIFTNGVLLAYSHSLGFSNSTILILLALPELISCLIILPLAYYTSRKGIKIIGSLGIIIGIAGYLLLILAALKGFNSLLFAFIGVTLAGIGIAMLASGWLALIGPLVDKSFRGRFIGILRFRWQLYTVIFSFIAISLIKYSEGSSISYTIILLIVIGSQILRFFIYNKIPDESIQDTTNNTLRESIFGLIKTPIFMSYCCYLFFLILATAACPWIINLSQKQFLAFTEAQIVFTNTLFLVGNLIGFYLGGIIIDKFGTKPVFIVAHFSFGILLFLFVARDLLIVPPLYSQNFLMLLFGIVTAASSIAITTELYEVLPLNKTVMATSFYVVVISLSKFLGAFISSQALQLKILSEKWSIGNFQFNCFDTMLIGNGCMVILLVMTLGLIPSVSKQMHKVNE